MINISQNLQILINAKLDIARSTQKIQADLNKIKNLNVNVGLDTKALSQMQSQINKLQTDLKRSGKGVRVVDEDQVVKSMGKVVNSVGEATKKYSELGQVTSKSTFDPATKEVDGFNMSVRRADGLVDNLRGEVVRFYDDAGNLQKGFEIVDKNQVDDTQRIFERQAQERQKIKKRVTADDQKLANQMGQVREQSMKRRLADEQKLARAQANAANRNMERSRKATQTEERQNQAIRQRLALFKQEQMIRMQNLQRTHGQGVDQAQARGFLRNVNQLNVATPQLSNRMRQLNMQFKQLGTNARTAAQSVGHASMSTAEMLRTAMVKFPINYPGRSKTLLIAGTPLEPFKLKRKDEICLSVNVEN